MWHRIAFENANNMRQGVDYAETGQAARVAQGFFGDGREVEILDRGISDFGRIEDFRQRVKPCVRDFGDADAQLQESPPAPIHARRSGS